MYTQFEVLTYIFYNQNIHQQNLCLLKNTELCNCCRLLHTLYVFMANIIKREYVIWYKHNLECNPTFYVKNTFSYYLDFSEEQNGK